MNDEKKKNDYLILLSLLLFLGAAAFLYLAVSEKKGLDAKKIEQELHPVHPDEINFNLKSTLQQQQLNQLKVLDEVNRGKYNPNAAPPRPENNNSISFESDNKNEIVQEALGKYAAEQRLILTPDEIVQNHLYEMQIMKKMDDAYKKEYAKRFIAYARTQGFAIKLDPQLKIVSMRRIQPERNPTTIRGEPAGKQ
jgi:hypothetical protein